MAVRGADPIDHYLGLLSRQLSGPARLKADLLTEARHGLCDAAADYHDAGLPSVQAQHRAVAEFGAAPEIAAAYQVELAALTTRRLSVRIVVVWLVLVATADQMWQGAPWAGPRPPTGYQLLSASLTWVWVVAGGTAGAAYLYLTWAARRGWPGVWRVSRTLGFALTAWLVLGALLSAGLFAWSLALWEAARTWPPMVGGMVGMITAHVWLAWAVRNCLTTTLGSVRPGLRRPRRPGSVPRWR